MHSRSSMSPTYHLPELGYITTFQSPTTQLRSIPNRNSQGKNFIKCSQSSFLLPNKISRNSEYLKNRNNKSLKKYCVPDTSQDGYASKSEDDNNLTSFRDALQKNLIALYRFCRPHTVIGTILGITSVSLLPVQTIADLTPTFFMGLLKALVPSVLMNIYVVGLNQLYDVEIDKVNKPDLPLASGDFSMETGATIVSISLLMSMTMGIRFKSPPLFLALFISFLLGSVYSIELPFLRWKRHAFLAASCILTVRAVVVQLAFFIHIQKYVLGRPLVITRSLMFATAFMCFFSAVIAVFKDIPDVDGDRHFGIQSFSVSQGQERVFWLCVYMLLFAYGAAVIVGASSCFMPSKLVTVLGHCTLASFLWLKTQSVDLSCKASITSFYMFIWKNISSFHSYVELLEGQSVRVPGSTYNQHCLFPSVLLGQNNEYDDAHLYYSQQLSR